MSDDLGLAPVTDQDGHTVGTAFWERHGRTVRVRVRGIEWAGDRTGDALSDGDALTVTAAYNAE